MQSMVRNDASDNSHDGNAWINAGMTKSQIENEFEDIRPRDLNQE